jgi:hypothetical protein
MDYYFFYSLTSRIDKHVFVKHLLASEVTVMILKETKMKINAYM